jgi:hypothetical protein
LSGFIISRTSDRIEIVADGAICEKATGIVRRNDAEKILVSPAIPLAIVTRGEDADVCVRIASIVIQIAADMRSFDYTLALVGDFLRSSGAALAKLPEVQFAMAGFSETAGAVTVIGQSYHGTLDGTPWPPGDLRPLGPLFTAGVAPVFAGDLEAAGLALGDQPADMLERRGIAAMDLLRSKPMAAADAGADRDVYLIGGHVQYVSLSREGSKVNKIVHRWPDEIGKPITP